MSKYFKDKRKKIKAQKRKESSNIEGIELDENDVYIDRSVLV